MEVDLLAPDGVTVLETLWRSSDDSRLWDRLQFDLTPWRGETVQLYMMVYNDGAGGTTGMFLDDVSVTTCADGSVGIAIRPSPLPGAEGRVIWCTGSVQVLLSFSPDGRLLAYGRHDGTVVLARNPFAGPVNSP